MDYILVNRTLHAKYLSTSTSPSVSRLTKTWLSDSTESRYGLLSHAQCDRPKLTFRLDKGSVSARPFSSHLVTDKSLLVPNYLASVLLGRGHPVVALKT